MLDDQSPVPQDANALRRISDRTGGVFSRAENQSELLQVFRQLGFRLTSRAEEREVTQWFVGVALAFALLTALLALGWFARLP